MSSAATPAKGWLMPKALCLIGLVLAILVFLVFLVDLILGLMGNVDAAPFKTASIAMDIVFLLASGAIAFLAFVTFKEQK